MTKRNISTVLTFEMFNEAILPRIEEIMEDKLHKYQIEVVDFKQEVLDEIKKLRDEVLVVNHQYRRTTDRIEDIEKKLSITPLNI